MHQLFVMYESVTKQLGTLPRMPLPPSPPLSAGLLVHYLLVSLTIGVFLYFVKLCLWPARGPSPPSTPRRVPSSPLLPLHIKVTGLGLGQPSTGSPRSPPEGGPLSPSTLRKARQTSRKWSTGKELVCAMELLPESPDEPKGAIDDGRHFFPLRRGWSM